MGPIGRWRSACLTNQHRLMLLSATNQRLTSAQSILLNAGDQCRCAGFPDPQPGHPGQSGDHSWLFQMEGKADAAHLRRRLGHPHCRTRRQNRALPDVRELLCRCRSVPRIIKNAVPEGRTSCMFSLCSDISTTPHPNSILFILNKPTLCL
jgi:hypothetical protein